jgi:hypothetical protein
MVRIILGIIVGFVVWSIVWVGSDQFLHTLSRDWYGAHQDKVALAVVNNESFNSDTVIVLIGLVRSVIATIMSGFIAAMVAGENQKTPMVLGIILLIVGIAVQVHLWNVFPIWYHFIFLFSLIPLSILGGRLKQTTAH